MYRRADPLLAVTRLCMPAWALRPYYRLFYGGGGGGGAPCVTKNCAWTSHVAPAPGRCADCCRAVIGGGEGGGGRSAEARADWAARTADWAAPAAFVELERPTKPHRERRARLLAEQRALIERDVRALRLLGLGTDDGVGGLRD